MLAAFLARAEIVSKRLLHSRYNSNPSPRFQGRCLSLLYPCEPEV